MYLTKTLFTPKRSRIKNKRHCSDEIIALITDYASNPSWLQVKKCTCIYLNIVDIAVECICVWTVLYSWLRHIYKSVARVFIVYKILMVVEICCWRLTHSSIVLKHNSYELLISSKMYNIHINKSSCFSQDSQHRTYSSGTDGKTVTSDLIT